MVSRFSFDESTGQLFRDGEKAGFKDGRYVRVFVTVDGKKRRLSAHRLIWRLAHGVWPDMSIDHKDGDGHNNAISNLRLATVQENMRNTAPKRNSILGIKGVRKTKYGKYQARITVNHIEHYLGTFDDLEAARNAFSLVAVQVHKQFAHPCLSESNGGHVE